MNVIADRIEGDYVVVEIEKGNMNKLPLVFVPNVKEGDVIDITINKDKTKKRKDNIKKLVSSLFKN